MKIPVHEARSQFLDLIHRAESGEIIELTRHGRTVVHLLASDHPGDIPLFGALKGEIEVPDKVFGPLSDEELVQWEEG